MVGSKPSASRFASSAFATCNCSEDELKKNRNFMDAPLYVAAFLSCIQHCGQPATQSIFRQTKLPCVPIDVPGDRNPGDDIAVAVDIHSCYYNFVRPHRALRFGREVRTPAVQAGLTKRRLTFRQIFSSRMVLVALGGFLVVFVFSTASVTVDDLVTRAA
jgi:hypothetical protein